MKNAFVCACAFVAAAVLAEPEASSVFALKDFGHVYDNPIPRLRSRQAMFPNLCELDDGTILCCFTISEAMESVDMRCHLAKSADGGKTWSEPWRMFKEGPQPESECCKCTNLGGGRVMALGYAAVRLDRDKPVSNSETGGLLSHRVFYAVSEDSGKTWSDRITVPETWRAHTEASAPLVRLRDGGLAAPITGFPDWSGRMTARRCGRMLVTRDEGKTWNDDGVCMDFGNGDVSCYEQRFCVLDSGVVVDIGWNENLAAGGLLPNHITYSTDGGKAFSKPISTGVKGQTASVCALGGEKFLAVVSRRRDTDEPGVYGYVCDFSERKWNVVQEGLIWSAGKGPLKRDRKMAEVFGYLKFGQPSVVRLRDGRFLFCLWQETEGRIYVDAGELDMSVPGMVRGKLADSASFEGLHPRFPKVFKFLRDADLSALKPGKYSIDGEDVYAMVSDVELTPFGGPLEAHREFIDVHVPISGEETLGFVYDKVGVDRAAFNGKDDYCLFDNPAMRPVALKKGDFVAFFPPYGAHAPGKTLGPAKSGHRKIVVKVRMH
ncbi:MAG TPA: YhcH/YjgK/YiaL family protein [Opitutales bacterium]|nr:YhcH/YjgK/YiaL family protein [Opitutales bacterium]